MNTTQKQLTKAKGFTIIEVVLVLAIAGLIFLMVLVALPALQRGQRDTGRKNDVGTVVSALQSYLSNNKGSFTLSGSTDRQNFLKNYVGNLSQYTIDTSGTSTEVTWGTGTGDTLPSSESNLVINIKSKCVSNRPQQPPTGVSSRNASVSTKLESSTDYFCQDL